MKPVETMIAPGVQDIVEIAQVHKRDVVMKRIVGPLMTDIMRPIYDEEFSPEELKSIPATPELETVQYKFIPTVRGLLKQRLEDEIAYSGPNRKKDKRTSIHKFYELEKARPDLFFYGHEHIFDEGQYSGIVVPLTVAGQIYKLEKGDAAFAAFAEFDHEAFLAIMRRESFDEILQHLTKGQNTFLGGDSTEPHLESPYFFNFHSPFPAEPLKVEDTYKICDGEVRGLSDQYHLAANLRRRVLAKKAEEEIVTKKGHQGAVSSGCPVRHSFVRSGEEQEPLILTAKNFLIAALKVSSEKLSITHDMPAVS